MEGPKSTAGQGLGIAGLILGILAIPVGIIPCTFYLGIVFGIIGIVLSLVALTQANRGFGPRGLITAALVCSIIGLTFASWWGFTLSRGGAQFIKEIIRENVHDDFFKNMNDNNNATDILHDLENGNIDTTDHFSTEMEQLTDTLQVLESE